MISQSYKDKVDILLQVLPYIAKEKIFALKGGTAINMFVRDMPRLSVDIDLVYLPINSREEALSNIENGLKRIKADLEKNIPDIKVQLVPLSEGKDIKLTCQNRNAQIKIEVNTITRGNVFPTENMQVVDAVQEEYGKFAAMNVVSMAELFGGKMCAAVDRQHPRDIFDVKLLLGNEGVTDGIWQSFIIALISHNRPIGELLSPRLKGQKSSFDNQFAGMTDMEFTYDDYEATRKALIEIINQRLSDNDKKFILSFENGEPDWSLFPIEILKNLPVVKWKLQNIQKLKKENPQKHAGMIAELKKVLGL